MTHHPSFRKSLSFGSILPLLWTKFRYLEPQKVKRLTGDLRQTEEMRKIGNVRVSKQAQHEALHINARDVKRAMRNGLQ
jgi:hypothetical protein